MNKNRLEAFSDGVLAIIITIMVLEIKIPHEPTWAALGKLVPVFISYVISFLAVGIYWGNHHNLLHAAKKINAPILLSNLNLLFWLTLMPFATAWMGENHFAPNTIIIYAIDAVLSGLSYGVLQQCILKTLDPKLKVVIAIRGQSGKVLVSFLCALAAIPAAYLHPAISGALFLIQSSIWLIPDKNIERALDGADE